MLKEVCCWAVLILAGAGWLPAATQTPSGGPDPVSSYTATLTRYCFACHNERLKTADLALNQAGAADPVRDAEIWEKVIRKLRGRTMPPAGAPRPEDSFYETFASYLEKALDGAAEAHPNPGRSATSHRLNRAEYANAVRDLLGLEIDAAKLLPSDDSGSFDNLGDLLSVSPGLMEKYLVAAGKISRLAVGDPSIPADVETYTVSPFLVQGNRMSEDLPFGTRGGLAVWHHFPLDGEYVLKVRLQRTEQQGYILGIAEPHFLDLRLDHARIQLFRFGGEHVGRSEGSGAADAVPPDFEQSQYERHLDDDMEVRFPAQAGTRLVQVAFLNENAAHESVYAPRSYATLADATLPNVNLRGAADPALSSVSITGPFDPQGPGDTPSRRAIFTCHPAAAPEEEPCARRILSRLARRAYRRPVTDEEVGPLLDLYQTGRQQGGFEAGIQMAVEGLLVSTEFLFRIERDPQGVPPNTAYQLSDLELASRLSFFLWSSIPDEELLGLAEQGKLSDPAVLEQQVRRMLADHRSQALIDNFAGQWLFLRNLKTKSPNRDVFPEFDETLRDAFAQETELFLEANLREDRPVLDLLTADFTFLNERLARHYGIPGVYGNRFRKVKVADKHRRGLLGHGSILMITALANRTSPVLRGKWVLENILAAPPPPPPPDVPPLKEKGEGAKGTMRQQMEEHRKNPACIVCHARMDPIGFALEPFDAIGKWRDSDDGLPIDASGTLPDGSAFQGPAELRQALLNRPELIAGAVSEKLLTYALGRTLESYDAPAVRKIVRQAAPRDYCWSSIILGIVRSVPFQMRRSAAS